MKPYLSIIDHPGYESEIVVPTDYGNSWIVATIGYKPTLYITAGAFIILALLLFRKRIMNAIHNMGVVQVLFILFLLIGMAVLGNDSNKPTPPPVVTVLGIEVTKCISDATGLHMEWNCQSNIVVGVDMFEVVYREQQIPARDGYGAWKTLGTTMATTYDNPQFLRNRDIQLKVRVMKGLEL